MGFREALSELKISLAGLYGERLKGVYLFGSYARDEPDEESDLDVLIVLDRVDDYSAEISRTSEVTAAASLRHGIPLSRVFATEQQWRNDRTLFFLNVREAATAMWRAAFCDWNTGSPS